MGSGSWAANRSCVACQRDGTTALPGVSDHLEVSVRIAGLAFGVNADALAGADWLAVGGAFDDQGVRACAEAVDGGLCQWPTKSRPKWGQIR